MAEDPQKNQVLINSLEEFRKISTELISLREDLHGMEEKSKEFATKADIEDIKKDVTLMRGALFGNEGDMKHSIVYILDKICEKFGDHMTYHEKQDGRQWDILKAVIIFVLTTGLGAGITYLFMKLGGT